MEVQLYARLTVCCPNQDDLGNNFQSYTARYGISNPSNASGSGNPLYLCVPVSAAHPAHVPCPPCVPLPLVWCPHCPALAGRHVRWHCC